MTRRYPRTSKNHDADISESSVTSIGLQYNRGSLSCDDSGSGESMSDTKVCGNRLVFRRRARISNDEIVKSLLLLWRAKMGMRKTVLFECFEFYSGPVPMALWRCQQVDELVQRKHCPFGA